MRVAEETWSLGVKIGLPIAVVLFVLGLLLFIVMLITRRGVTSYSRADYTALAMIGLITSIVTVLVSIWAFWPLEREYHRWYPVAGEVEQIERRILGSGNSISERVLIEIKGQGQYGCDDTRCTGLKAGDQVSLTCKLEWQYTGTDGWACRYYDSEQNSE